MEADWEFEIATDAPVIEAAWAGFIDLRREPEQVGAIVEVMQLPALGPALLHLNSVGSPVFTAKCDVWDPGEIDADELDADRSSATHALACYIDVLPVDLGMWATPESAGTWSRGVCEELANVRLRQCRVDLVIRRAFLKQTQQGIGITCYIAGCGANQSEAADTLSRALRALSDAAAGLPMFDFQA